MPVFKIVRTTAVLVGLLAASDCRQAVVPEPDMKVLLSDAAVDSACRTENFNIDVQAYAPDQFDQDRFYEQRYNKGNNTLKYPLPVLCIYRAYGGESLKAWAEKGDVVARYTLFQVRHEKDCSTLKSDVDFLYDLGHIEFKNKYGVTMSRLPEAYELAAKIQLTCGMIDASDESSERALKAGYEPHLSFSE